MSCIVVLKEKDRYVVGTDVRVSDGNIYFDGYLGLKKAKHIDFNNELIIGCVGNLGLIYILELVLEKVHKINDAAIIKEVVPLLMQSVMNTCFIDNNRFLDGQLLIAYKDKAYIISNNFSVSKVVDEFAFGSGARVAYGSLYTSKTLMMTPEQRIVLAINAAAHFVESVSSEVFIGDTKGQRFRKIN